MRTRSQTKKEKLDKEKTKIPQLNEDVLGIILKHVVKKERRHIIQTLNIILQHKLSVLRDFRPPRDMIWPDHLNTNSRRLIYHTKTKLFPNNFLDVSCHLEDYITRKRDLDLLWVTMKHFGLIRAWKYPTLRHNYTDIRLFFQEIWTKFQGRRLLFEKLEERLT